MATINDERLRIYLRQIYSFLKNNRDYLPSSPDPDVFQDLKILMLATEINFKISLSDCDFNIDYYIYDLNLFHCSWNEYLSQFRENFISVTGNSRIPGISVYNTHLHHFENNKIVHNRLNPPNNMSSTCSLIEPLSFNKKTLFLVNEDHLHNKNFMLNIPIWNKPEERLPKRKSLCDADNRSEYLKIIERIAQYKSKLRSFYLKSEPTLNINACVNFVIDNAVKSVFVDSCSIKSDYCEYHNKMLYIGAVGLRFKHPITTYLLSNVEFQQFPFYGELFIDRINDPSLLRIWNKHDVFMV